MKKGKESKDILLRPGGRPLAKTLSESVRQLEIAGAAYLYARENGRARGVLSKRRDRQERFDVPQAHDPVIELRAQRVVVTRPSLRDIRGTPLRVRRGHWAAKVFILGEERLVPLESGAGSDIGGGTGVMFGTEYRRSGGEIDRKARQRELANASRRRRVGLFG